MTETVELYEIEEYELKGLLNYLSDIHDKKKGILDDGLTPMFRNFGELDNLIFGVHLFTQKNGTLIYIILSEYLRDARIAAIRITSIYTVGIFSYNSDVKGEIKVRELLEELTYEELDSYAEQVVRDESDEIFNCPNCHAQYRMRVLRMTEEGKLECQNCKKSFDTVELDVAKRAASHDS